MDIADFNDPVHYAVSGGFIGSLLGLGAADLAKLGQKQKAATIVLGVLLGAPTGYFVAKWLMDPVYKTKKVSESY